MKKKLLSILISTSLVCAMMIGCTSTDSSTDTSTTDTTNATPTTEDSIDNQETVAEPEELVPIVLNEVAHSIFYAPMYVAIEMGYFEEEGIDLELVTGFGADNVMAALLADEAQIGFMGPESTIYTYQEGANDVIINFAQLTQRAGNFLVAREEMPDFTWNDLVGTDVLAGRAGGMPQMVFEYILKENGIEPTTDVAMDQSIDFGSTAAAFMNNKGDFTVEFEPSATLLEQQGDDYHIVASLGVDSGYVPYTAFSAKESYLEEHPEIVKSFVSAMKKGVTYCDTATTDEIASIIAPQFEDTDVETIATIVARYDSQETWNESLVFEEESFELLQDILESCDVLEKRVPYNELVTTEFVD